MTHYLQPVPAFSQKVGLDLLETKNQDTNPPAVLDLVAAIIIPPNSIQINRRNKLQQNMMPITVRSPQHEL